MWERTHKVGDADEDVREVDEITDDTFEDSEEDGPFV